ncbi:MAG TPA: DUF4129 domain-containing protein, partial [Pirellula sp.]|nr:DUF4129 domain-containing protein [Pirellula sp.]
WVPRIRLRHSTGLTQDSGVDFYNRAVRLLKRVGIQRGGFQTQREFFQVASKTLNGHFVELDAELLSRLFYERRFGGLIALAESDQAVVDSTLQSLEADTSKWKKQVGFRNEK